MIGISPLKRVESRFLLDPFEPAYLALDRAGELAERVSAGLRELEDCCACPRNCHVNRMADLSRVCHTGRYARVASSFPHFGEEDCLRGWCGSGMIFFGLAPFLVPLPMMLMGVLVSFIQAFVFMLLAMIYIQGSLEHAH